MVGEAPRETEVNGEMRNLNKILEILQDKIGILQNMTEGIRSPKPKLGSKGDGEEPKLCALAGRIRDHVGNVAYAVERINTIIEELEI